MVYQHSDDISEGKIFMPKLNELISTAVNRTVNATDTLKHSSLTGNLRGLTNEELVLLDKLCEDFRLVITLLLKSFIFTHTSIIHIHLLGNEEREKNNKTVMAYGSDAMSLVREQIEKVFVVTLLCNDPIKWIKIYMKDEWNRIYQYNLNLKAENQNLPRFVEHYNNEFPEYLERAKKIHGISDEEQQFVDFKFNNPNTELPAYLRQYKIRQFPNPGEAKREVTEPTAKECLERWYWEYKYFCGFNHAGFSKMRFLMVSDRRFKELFEQSNKEQAYDDKIIQTSLWMSYTACASATSELLKYLSNDLEVVVALTELWDILQKESPIGKAMWNIRAKYFFPLI